MFVEHDGAGNERLGIRQIGIEVFLVPDEIGRGVARRIAKACKASGLAPLDARQHWSLARRIGRVQRMTCGALLLEEIGSGRGDRGRKRRLCMTGSDPDSGEGDERRKP